MPDEVAERVDRWFATRTLHGVRASEGVRAHRGAPRVGVVLPARDEEATVGSIVHALRDALTTLVPLVGEIVVVDSGSTDATAQAARDAGARVVAADSPPGFDGGKGAALRTGLATLTSEIGVFLDADVPDFDPGFVTGLVGPLLADPSLVLTKAFYDRPAAAGGGGRVTELVARPAIAEFAPELAGFVQPLAGECAFRRDALLDDPVASGYAVDLALLWQTVRRHGLDAVAQVDLGRREHRHQDLPALGRMAVQVRDALRLAAGDADAVVTERLVPRRDPDGETRLEPERIETRWLPPVGR